MGSLAITVPASPDLSTSSPSALSRAARRVKAAARAAWSRAKGAALWLLGVGRVALGTLGALASMAVGYVKRRVSRTKKTDQDEAMSATVEHDPGPTDATADPVGAVEPREADDDERPALATEHLVRDLAVRASLVPAEVHVEGSAEHDTAPPAQNAPALGSDWPFTFVRHTLAPHASIVKEDASDPATWSFRMPLASAGADAEKRAGDVY